MVSTIPARCFLVISMFTLFAPLREHVLMSFSWRRIRADIYVCSGPDHCDPDSDHSMSSRAGKGCLGDQWLQDSQGQVASMLRCRCLWCFGKDCRKSVWSTDAWGSCVKCSRWAWALCLLGLVCVYQDRISLCNPGWIGTQSSCLLPDLRWQGGQPCPLEFSLVIHLWKPCLETMLVVRRAQVSFRTLVRSGPCSPRANTAHSCHRGFFRAGTDELHVRFCSVHINARVS